jgi:hypothetical protein
VISGTPGGTYFRMASDMAFVLDDGDIVRGRFLICPGAHSDAPPPWSRHRILTSSRADRLAIAVSGNAAGTAPFLRLGSSRAIERAKLER